MSIGPKKLVTYTCYGCDNLTREFDWHEGWYDCYCKGNKIGCFFPGEDIWPGVHSPSITYKCPMVISDD